MVRLLRLMQSEENYWKTDICKVIKSKAVQQILHRLLLKRKYYYRKVKHIEISTILFGYY